MLIESRRKFNAVDDIELESITYVVIDAFAGRRSSLHDVVVVSVIDKQQSAGLDTFLEVSDCLLLLALIAKRVRHVSE